MERVQIKSLWYVLNVLILGEIFWIMSIFYSRSVSLPFLPMQYAPWGWRLWATLSGSCPLLSIWFDQSDALGRRRENPGYLFSSALPACPLFGSGYIICLKPQHLMGGLCSTAFLRPPHCCCFMYFPDEIGEVGRIMALTDVHCSNPYNLWVWHLI